MEIRTIGIDLGKTVFHFVAVNARGQVVCGSQEGFTDSAAALYREPSSVPDRHGGRRGGSHFLGRALREQGHDVRA